ncbi:gamma-tubulin complex component 4 homolog [Contarinia nasturtii]|uniref:gamma-tubulin complex component 4 homolog n=1 Tax=Contarinia nasturtii TaxID=265458 RepID=UPI0012D3BA76|nr:gamma-tubulin complex component 4 homolog [Contarinia nasturtii]XP_031632313.1 gamma-tubulin complex component 4 homolog [Contarinia nasturtii]
MIHDIILCLLDPTPVNTSMTTYLRVYDDYFHPSEIQMLKEILKCAKIHQVIRQFITKYSSRAVAILSVNGAVQARNGIYLESFATAVDSSLDPFRNKMLELEREYIKNGHLSINYFLTQIKEYQTFFHFLEQLINEIETQKLHGCAILNLLHKYNHHADPKCLTSLKTIRLSVYAVFLRQLSQWLIYGQIVDIYAEFFIIHCSSGSESKNTAVTTITTNTVLSERASTRSELQFQIAYDMVPCWFPASWAENVLFIGQTVRMLVDDPRKIQKKMSIWNDEDEYATMESLWNKREHIYFNKIQKLYNCNSIDNGSYEYVVHEIKQYVTVRLSEIAFNQADLIKHLKLFKDYYLLGRGELFLEFLMQLKNIETSNGVTENLAREVNQAFQKALNRTSIDTDQIAVSYIPCAYFIDSDDDIIQKILKSVRLNFNVKWPLHLFFSPSRVIEQYNELFGFLLQIRQLQNELHDVWRLHRDNKIAGNSMKSQLRNKMLFFIDNLQYYLQVDVVESQFSILINAVQNSKDFEFIQRSHNIFQANVMSLSFLLNSITDDASNDTCQSQNTVLRILNKIFKTVRKFCKFNENTSDQTSTETHQVIEIFDEQYSNHIKELLSLLSSNRTAGPLSQLLLRLDFNHWFSSHTV